MILKPKWVLKQIQVLLRDIDIDGEVIRLREEIPHRLLLKPSSRKQSKRLKLAGRFPEFWQQAGVDGVWKRCRYCRQICVRWCR
jgi:hypothetical protein